MVTGGRFATVKPRRDITECDHWRQLVDHDPVPTLRELFDREPERVRRWVVDAGDLRVDLSKHLVDETVWAALISVAHEMDIEGRRDEQLTGRVVNTTEQRPAAHTVLRAPRHTSVRIAGEDAVVQVHDVLDAMANLANQVRDGHWRGSTGRRVRTVINIGIGGSDLGPHMAYEALRHLVMPGLECRFVSNVDGAHLATALRDVDPAETLLVVSSKTFTTAETMANAHSARAWLVESLGEDAVGDHMVAVTTNVVAAGEFGVRPESVFGFWDWVGGRFSLDSAIGLSVMIAVGPETFGEMLAGMRLVDEHFATAPLHRNAPVLMALLGVWYTGVLGLPTRAVVPYAQALHRFPAYLQQLEMESNGKSVRHDGSPVVLPTSPVVWGEPGTNGQHAFFQLLHQGTQIVPVDFIGFSRSPHVLGPSVDLAGHHDMLLANLLAQSAALAFGRTAEEAASAGVAPELVAHRTFPGNRPSTVILAEALTASTLGQLVALYEHMVATQGMLWGINSFDQWGVELGKELASSLVPALESGSGVQRWDPSTREAIGWLRRTR